MTLKRTLHHFPLDPASRQVRLALGEKRLPFTEVQVRYWERPKALTEMNPSGLLPVLIEADGDARKLLRVTLPLGVSLRPGTRVVIDNGQPMTAPYVICVPNGCVADYEASGDLIAKMKAGQRIHVQGINGSGQPVSLQLPLTDFAKSYDGPATDPKPLEPPKP